MEEIFKIECTSVWGTTYSYFAEGRKNGIEMLKETASQLTYKVFGCRPYSGYIKKNGSGYNALFYSSLEGGAFNDIKAIMRPVDSSFACEATTVESAKKSLYYSLCDEFYKNHLYGKGKNKQHKILEIYG